jgi:hypothetical protein
MPQPRDEEKIKSTYNLNNERERQRHIEELEHDLEKEKGENLAEN